MIKLSVDSNKTTYFLTVQNETFDKFEGIYKLMSNRLHLDTVKLSRFDGETVPASLLSISKKTEDNGEFMEQKTVYEINSTSLKCTTFSQSELENAYNEAEFILRTHHNKGLQ
jgi:hypothetical protein